MRVLAVTLSMLIYFVSLAGGQYPPPAQPSPSPTPRPRPVEHRLPEDQPEQAKALAQRRPADAARVRRDAEELTRLAQSIPFKLSSWERVCFRKT